MLIQSPLRCAPVSPRRAVLPWRIVCALMLGSRAYAQTAAQLQAQVRDVVRIADQGAAARWPATLATATPTPVQQLLRGTRDRVTYRHAAAESVYVRLANDTLASAPIAAYAASGLGALYGQQSRHADAVMWYERAVARLRALGDSAGEADALTGFALSASRTRGVNEAAARIDAALMIAPARDETLRAMITCTDILLRTRAGRAITAIEWTRALAGASAGGPRAQSQCLFARAMWWDNRGQGDSTLHMLDTVAAVQRRSRLLVALSATRQWQGWTRITLGQYAGARDALTEAVRLGAETGTLTSEGWANLNLAELSQRVGEWGAAKRYADRGIAALTKSGDQIGLVSARNVLAKAALRHGDLVLARREYEALIEPARAASPQYVVWATAALAEIARRQHRFADAARLIEVATADAQRLQMTGWRTDLDYQRAVLALAQAQPERAIALLTPYLGSAELQRGASRFEVQSRIAEAKAMAGQLNDAATTLQRAMKEFDSWRAPLSERELLLTALGDRELDWDADLGLASMIAIFAQSGRVAQASQMADWRRAQLLQRQSLQRVAYDAGGAANRARPTMARLQDARQLPPGVVIVSYVAGNVGAPTTVFVQSALETVAIAAAPIDSLADALVRFSAFVSQGTIPSGLSRRLSDALIGPVLRVLPADARRLVLVPDGALHRVPFAALPLTNGRPLGAQYELVTAPSVAIALSGLSGDAESARATAGDDRAVGASRQHPIGVALTAATDTRSSTRTHTGRRGVVAFGAPDSLPAPRDATVSWTVLPGALSELRRVARATQDSRIIEGREATSTAFRDAAGAGGAVLHIATHAQASDVSITQSVLVTRPSATDDGLLRAGALAAMSIPFDLVVLSACESAIGPIVPGEGMQGLASAFLEAGARSVLATRWRVNDALMERFVSDFYAELTTGHDAAAALFAARRRAIDAGVSPAVWAGFELLGDPYTAPTVAVRAASDGALVVVAIATLILVSLLALVYFVRVSERTALRR